jgi:hypothetical protein
MADDGFTQSSRLSLCRPFCFAVKIDIHCLPFHPRRARVARLWLCSVTSETGVGTSTARSCEWQTNYRAGDCEKIGYLMYAACPMSLRTIFPFQSLLPIGPHSPNQNRPSVIQR